MPCDARHAEGRQSDSPLYHVASQDLSRSWHTADRERRGHQQGEDRHQADSAAVGCFPHRSIEVVRELTGHQQGDDPTAERLHSRRPACNGVTLPQSREASRSQS